MYSLGHGGHFSLHGFYSLSKASELVRLVAMEFSKGSVTAVPFISWETKNP